MTRFAILLGGQVTPTERLKQQIAGSRLIAADGGMEHTAALGVEPEVWIGDFDSCTPEQQAKHGHIPRIEFPVAKDATDGDLAISEAFRRGATEIVLVGGFGGQFDHVLAHATMLLAMARREIPCMMTSGSEEAYPLSWQINLDGLKAGTRISIVPTSDIKGLTLRGVRWPLEHRSVPFGSTLTLSNATTGDVVLTMDAGSGLLIVYPREN
jgi:thiamine pyrophosphokinase